MSKRTPHQLWVGAFLCWALLCHTCSAGMPAVLPTGWTKDSTPEWASGSPAGYDGSADVRWQAISFFIAGLLVSAWGVQRLWRVLQRDLRWLPPPSYGRAVSFVVLWGLLFILVLTMISGARELMTPGAWRKQGWTYKLAQSAEAAPSPEGRTARRQALEQLRLKLWQYAATHDGKFPNVKDAALDPGLWNIPDWPGLSFSCVPDRRAEDQGRLLVYEPELDGDERQVLLTNGLIGTMRTPEITQALKNAGKP